MQWQSFKHFSSCTKNNDNKQTKPKRNPKRAANCSLRGLVSGSAYVTLLIISPLQSYAESLPSHLPHPWPLPFVCSLSPFLPHLCQGLTLCSSVQLELQVPVRCPLKHWGCRHPGPCPVHRFLSLNLQFLFTNAHFGVVSPIRVHRRLFVTFFSVVKSYMPELKKKSLFTCWLTRDRKWTFKSFLIKTWIYSFLPLGLRRLMLMEHYSLMCHTCSGSTFPSLWAFPAALWLESSGLPLWHHPGKTPRFPLFTPIHLLLLFQSLRWAIHTRHIFQL